ERTRREARSLLETRCAEHGITPVPALEWSTRMRRVLGRAYVQENRIRLSAWLDERQAADTLRHELAHIAVGRSRRRPHGPRWRAWAARLGAEPRAAAKAEPAHAPPRSPGHRHVGLECANCGTRFVRQRVLRGLYCAACGPRKGTLVRAAGGDREAMRTWAGHSPAPTRGSAA
ncbi:MAG: SprT-like domain-containing protein, partial [Chloroflexi bacterium]|nr:SprT-like domain-containing protein [Chloroflexota bacterium]